MRNDKEKILTSMEQKKIEQELILQNWEIQKTSMHSGEFLGINGRKEQVYNKLAQIQDSGLVVTDTLHCMISAALTGTPCIAFNNLSGKVENVYKWIEKCHISNCATNELNLRTRCSSWIKIRIL